MTTYHTLRLVAALGLSLVLAGCGDQPEDSILKTGKKLYSQANEELVIRDFFEDRRGGYFVDVGCYHWARNSTTYYLEKHLGWSGIGIDAQAAFGRGYAQHRPNTKFFSYIVTDHSGTTESLYLGDGLSSTSAEWVMTWRKQGGAPQAVQVPTITLNELLDAEGITHIDFLSMDIEGGEPSALRGFDIDRFRPELVCVETAGGTREAVAEYFENHNYELLSKYSEYDPLNSYYTPRR